MSDPLKTLLAICDGCNLLLPAALVADIRSGVNATAATSTHPWQQGTLAWQGAIIPVVSFEQLILGRPPRLRGSHICILRGTTDTRTLPFYGLPTQAQPSEYSITSPTELAAADPPQNLKMVATATQIKTVPCLIPNFEEIETRLAEDLQNSP
ncbi:MAG: hypothetical protein GDA55_06185 [Cellvibrionales bacterium]|nr:hypothetical protein [Cellvibrionales bacterium]